MKKILILIIAIFVSYTVSQAGTGNTVHSMIKKQIGIPAQLKNQKMNETVNVQFKVKNGKANILDVKTANSELKQYIITKFNTINFDKIGEDQEITYFIDISFKVL
jgi:predicted Holliday junction resolvase-like endonuclease